MSIILYNLWDFNLIIDKTALMFAVQKENIEMIKLLLSQKSIDVNIQNI